MVQGAVGARNILENGKAKLRQGGQTYLDMSHGLLVATQLGNDKGGVVDEVPTTRIRDEGETSRIRGNGDTDSS